MNRRNVYLNAEHPFAVYVRALGKGKSGARSLTLDEARDAMGMILRGEVLDVQLGAFLMLLRVKEESPEELAGFVMAARTYIDAPKDIPVDLDWSSYAGKRRHLPWFLLAVRTLAQHGIRVFMHGASGHTINRLYTESVLPELGMPVCANWSEVRDALDSNHFAYMPLATFCPPLGDMIGLRNVLGLRSPVHTLSRLLNPLDAPHVIQAIFHPAYRTSHRAAARLLEYRHSCVFKGEGGEIERNPDGVCLTLRLENSEPVENEWPMLFEQRHEPESELAVEDLLAVWRGDAGHEYGEAAVIGTLAIALLTLQKATTPDEAMALAKQWWETRLHHY